MRIYAHLIDIGTEYETLVANSISLVPFASDCVYLDLEGNEEYDNLVIEGDSENKLGGWKPYNYWYYSFAMQNIDTGEIIYYWPEDDTNWIEGEVYLHFKEGILTNEPKFRQV